MHYKIVPPGIEFVRSGDTQIAFVVCSGTVILGSFTDKEEIIHPFQPFNIGALGLTPRMAVSAAAMEDGCSLLVLPRKILEKLVAQHYVRYDVVLQAEAHLVDMEQGSTISNNR